MTEPCFLKRYPGYRLILFALLFLFSSQLAIAIAPAVAETRAVHGLLFHVDELRQVDRSNVRVSLFGESIILPESSLDNYLVHKYLDDSQASERFELDRLQVFVESSLESSDIEWAALGLVAYLRHSEASLEKSLDLVESLATVEQAEELFKAVLPSLKPIEWDREYTYSMLIHVGVRDTRWVRANVARELYRRANGIINFIFDRFLEATAREDIEAASALTTLVGELFGERDPRYERLKIALQKARQAIQASSGEEIFTLIRSTEGEPFLAATLQPILRRVIHKSAATHVSEGDPSEALSVLSQVPVSERSPETHDLVIAAIAALKPSDRSVVFNLPVAVMLREMSANDERLRQAYVRFLQQQAEFYLNALELFRVEKVLEEMGRFLEPQAPAVHDLQLRLGIAWLEARSPARAKKVIGEVESTLSIVDRFRLLAAGYYIDLNLLILLSTIPIILIWLIILRVKAVRAGKVENAEEIFVYGRDDPRNQGDMRQFRKLTSDSELDSPASFSTSVKHGLNPRMQEYRNLLRKFGLGQNATAKEIKAAYRAAVKEVHPDTQHGRSGEHETKDVFIRMTSTYERILELRKSLRLQD